MLQSATSPTGHQVKLVLKSTPFKCLVLFLCLGHPHLNHLWYHKSRRIHSWRHHRRCNRHGRWRSLRHGHFLHRLDWRKRLRQFFLQGVDARILLWEFGLFRTGRTLKAREEFFPITQTVGKGWNGGPLENGLIDPWFSWGYFILYYRSFGEPSTCRIGPQDLDTWLKTMVIIVVP